MKKLYSIATSCLLLLTVQASAGIVGAPYSAEKFTATWGNKQIAGEIQKISHFKNKSGNYFMVLSKKTVTDSDETETYNLYAYGFAEKNGSLHELWQFKDFSTSVYWPKFYKKETNIFDTDQDGNPEFMVAYFGSSDGLDAKSLKIITYLDGVKYKATASYPAGNEEDRYRIVYDKNFSSLPKPIQIYVNKVFKKIKPMDNFQ